MNPQFTILYVAALTSLPWVAWFIARKYWLHRRERKVLQEKYGDLEMFAERLKEWKVMR